MRTVSLSSADEAASFSAQFIHKVVIISAVQFVLCTCESFFFVTLTSFISTTRVLRLFYPSSYAQLFTS